MTKLLNLALKLLQHLRFWRVILQTSLGCWRLTVAHLTQHLLENGRRRCFHRIMPLHGLWVIRCCFACFLCYHVLRLDKIVIPLALVIFRELCGHTAVGGWWVLQGILKDFLFAPGFGVDVTLIYRLLLRSCQHFLQSVEVCFLMERTVRYKSLRLFQLRLFPFGESLLLKGPHASPNIRLSQLVSGGTIDFVILG